MKVGYNEQTQEWFANGKWFGSREDVEKYLDSLSEQIVELKILDDKETFPEGLATDS